MGVCLILATLAVTTYEERRPTVDLGALATAQTGSACPSPSASAVSALRSKDASGRPHSTNQSDAQSQTVLLMGDSTACTLLPGLQAVGPSYGMKFENGAVVGCGVVSGTHGPRPIPSAER